MGKVVKDMYHCVRYEYSFLGCVFFPGGGGVKGRGVRVETTRLKNIGGIKSEGVLMFSFVFFKGSSVCKYQHNFFLLWCVISVLP